MATANTQAISRPHVVAGNVRGIATLSKPVSTVGNASTGNVQTGSQKQQEAIQRASEISKKGSYQTTIQTGNQREKDIGRQSRLAPYQNKKIGLNLGTGNIKSALHFAESALDKQDDLATQSVSSSMRSAEMTYKGVKTGWKMSQKTSDMLVKVAGGTYTVGLATITIKRSTQTYLQTAQYFPSFSFAFKIRKSVLTILTRFWIFPTVCTIPWYIGRFIRPDASAFMCIIFGISLIPTGKYCAV